MAELITPIVVLSSVCFVLGNLLVLADKYLADYGECKIIISGEEEFTVRGGSTILPYLTERNIFIPSACGGKATCGYCKVKVLDGGGQILPTERPFLTREEKNTGIRLACQVKVKNDIEIYMPDFLETVKNIVENRLYDPKLRWKFILDGQDKKSEKIDVKLIPEDKTKIYELIEEFKDVEGSLVPALQNINSTYNYLPEPVLRYVSEELNTPLSEMYRIATFYNAFSLKPRGKNIVKVCLGTSCYVKGGKIIAEAIKNKLGIEIGETTEDLSFSFESVSCIGCCGQSPVMSINNEIYGYLKYDMIDNILEKYKAGV